MVAVLEAKCEAQDDEQILVDISYNVLKGAGEYRREESEIIQGFLAFLSIDGFAYGDNNLTRHSRNQKRRFSKSWV